MSLRTGTELSTLVLLLNKVSGVYGILALLTGLHLSALQLSMYLYSILALGLLLYLAPHVRTQRPFECLALGTFFVLDSVINALWTVAFAVTWFAVIGNHPSAAESGAGKTMNDAAGFSKPQHNVSNVDVIVGPDQGIPGDRPEAVTAGSGSAPLSNSMFQPESMASIAIICGLWVVRVYLTLIVCSYTRNVLRKHCLHSQRSSSPAAGKDVAYLENPFARHLPEGSGLRGRLGRIMIVLGKSFWLQDDSAADDIIGNDVMLGRVRRQDASAEASGVVERERRRRSGTVRSLQNICLC